MNNLLTQTLSAIERESPEFDESFDLAKKLVELFGEQDLGRRLYSEIDTKTNWRVVADLYAILIWEVSDKNVGELAGTLKQWLIDGDDVRKIRVAINSDVCPFKVKVDMVNAFEGIKRTHPHLTEELDSFLGDCWNCFRSETAEEKHVNGWMVYAALAAWIVLLIALSCTLRYAFIQ